MKRKGDSQQKAKPEQKKKREPKLVSGLWGWGRSPSVPIDPRSEGVDVVIHSQSMALASLSFLVLGSLGPWGQLLAFFFFWSWWLHNTGEWGVGKE